MDAGFNTPIHAPIDPPSPPTLTFPASEVSVIFVLGGPGAGKGTQCARLARSFRLQHLSVGDVLRKERDTLGSEYGPIIARNMEEGRVGPKEITVKLMSKAMDEAVQNDGVRLFLIDGFPRKMDQLHLFEQTVCPASFALFLDISDGVRRMRLLERGKIWGRLDDNPEVIQKRFETFKTTSMVVVDYLESKEKIKRINADRDEQEVYLEIRDVLSEALRDKLVV